MTTYAIEEVQRLNNSLLELQRDLIYTSTSIKTNNITTRSLNESDINISPKQAWEQKNKNQFLFSANKALDASFLKNNLDIEDINNYLSWYLSFEHEVEVEEEEEKKKDSNGLSEWLFVTKCTLGVYGHTLSNILNSTLPLSQSLVYWDSIYGSIWYEIYYGLQTVPSRLYQLIDNTRKMVLDSSISPPTNASTLTTTTVSSKLKHLLTSSDHILGSLFPLTLQKNNLAKFKEISLKSSDSSLSSSFSSSSSPKSSIKYDPSKTIAHVIGKLYNTSLPLALIRDEIRQKRQYTRYYRTHQAATLGLLIKLAPNFDTSSSSSLSIEKLNSSQQELSVHRVALSTIQCIKSLSSCLQDQSNISINAFSINTPNQNLNMQLKLDEIKGSLTTFSSTDTQPKEVIMDLKNIVDNQHVYQQHLSHWKLSYGIPSRLIRYWLPGLTIYFASQQLSNYVFDRKEDIMEWGNYFTETVHDFFIHWVWEPTLKVLDTIRVKEENQQFGVSSKEGLRSDLDSLERMVIQFAKEKHNVYQLSDQDILQLGSKVRDGDMSIVLRAYENEIKNPLKNVIRGDLIQTLLIQIQKTKVDVDMAMQALDKLLKSNELNFAFLAVAPSMILTWGAISWIKNVYIRRGSYKIKRSRRPIKDTIRRIERLFTLDTSENDEELTCESQGALLCELLLLRNYAQSLPTRNGTRELFIEDIRDLETVTLTKKQKVETISRMYRTWYFLLN